MPCSELNRRAGWRYFSAWERRFRSSARTSSLNPKFNLFLAQVSQLSNSGYQDGYSSWSVENKIGFLKAYLTMREIDSVDFRHEVQMILTMQGKLKAPRLYGFFFHQAEPEKFGAGVADFFQSSEGSVYCKHARQIDFADVFAIQPFDAILVRKPKGLWDKARVVELARLVKDDLSADGIRAKVAGKSFYSETDDALAMIAVRISDLEVPPDIWLRYMGAQERWDIGPSQTSRDRTRSRILE